MIACSWQYLEKIPELGQPLTSLKGVGSKRAGLLAEKGIKSMLDLFYFLPTRYEDRTRLVVIDDAADGERVWVSGSILSAREEFFPRSRKRLFRVLVEDPSGRMHLIWFHYRKAYLSRIAKKGASLLAFGRIQESGPQKQMIHPEIIPGIPEQTKDFLAVNPVYPAIDGVSQRTVKLLISEAFRLYGDCLPDPLPAPIRQCRNLPDLVRALREVHMPPAENSVRLLNAMETQGHRRLRFDLAFRSMLNLSLRKTARKRRPVKPLTVPADLEKRLHASLPFALTGGQRHALQDILRDFRTGYPMSRLIQGDVGCGKTVVAAVAAYVAIRNEKQVALMAPTQVLARQHWASFRKLSGTMGFEPALLTSSLKAPERERIYEEIREGTVNVIIGTQALVQDSLSFSHLGLAIIDEQHRFGVRQRALLDSKGNRPHVLAMSATPIPRTLCMTFYGDMDISTIRESPKGRLPVVTRLVERSRKTSVYRFLKKRLEAEQQALVICPVIEAGEDEDLKDAVEMAGKLENLFSPQFRVALIHGRLPALQKDAIMEDFRNGRIHLLVSTTVVEVGLHVPNASVMVIEQPERFGLAQLHQLRGRIGRGPVQGVCLLMLSEHLTEQARQRLAVLTRSTDGFEIARKDLELRGHGEIMGVKQAGTGEWDVLDVLRDPDLFVAAREEAEKIVQEDPGFTRSSSLPLREILEPEWKKPLEM
jgi:ATP-dependent DNA helicase RecG